MIKLSHGRTDFRVDPEILRRDLMENGYCELAVTSTYAMTAGHRPFCHKDPFDKILVAQAITEGSLLLTVDEDMARHPGRSGSFEGNSTPKIEGGTKWERRSS